MASSSFGFLFFHLQCQVHMFTSWTKLICWFIPKACCPLARCTWFSLAVSFSLITHIFYGSSQLSPPSVFVRSPDMVVPSTGSISLTLPDLMLIAASRMSLPLCLTNTISAELSFGPKLGHIYPNLTIWAIPCESNIHRNIPEEPFMTLR